MRGVYCNGRSIAFESSLPDPTPEEGEEVLEVRLAGICDTDLQLARGYMNFQGVLGHEFVATTQDGRRVTAEINNACDCCPTCRAGRRQHCPHRTVLGIHRHDGAMADRVCVPSRNIHPIPDDVDDREAVFIEPLAAAFRIIQQVPLEPGIRMAVLGDGKLGLLCAWVARLSGASVLLVGKHPAKLAMAGEGIEVGRLDELAELGRDFDVVADCTGSKTGFPTALRLVRPCGTIVFKTTVAGDHTLNLAPLVVDEVTVIGSRCGPFPIAIDALTRRLVDVRPLIGSLHAIDAAEEAFREASSPGARKILLEVGTSR